jgi:hypothetical protein
MDAEMVRRARQDGRDVLRPPPLRSDGEVVRWEGRQQVAGIFLGAQPARKVIVRQIASMRSWIGAMSGFAER